MAEGFTVDDRPWVRLRNAAEFCQPADRDELLAEAERLERAESVGGQEPADPTPIDHGPSDIFDVARVGSLWPEATLEP